MVDSVAVRPDLSDFKVYGPDGICQLYDVTVITVHRQTVVCVRDIIEASVGFLDEVVVIL